MQVEIMKWFQGLFENFTGFFDIFFSFFTFFGEGTLLFILLPVLYWTINKDIGKILGFACFTSVVTNDTLKEIAKIERPISNPDIRFVEIDNLFVNTVDLKNSYSFPSGHSQNISVTCFTLALYYNKKKLWILSTILVLLVMASRMYLGVHWPIDVIIGGLLGLIIACVMYIVHKKCNPSIYDYIYIGVAVLSLFTLFISRSSGAFRDVGCLLGFAFGSFAETKFVKFDPKVNPLWKKIVRVVVGLLLLFGLKAGLKPLFNLIGDYAIFDLIRYFIIIFVAICLYPWLFKKLNF